MDFNHPVPITKYQIPKNMKNNILKFGLLALFFLAYTLPVMADLDNPPDYDEDNDPPAQIDNWVLILSFAGIVLGIYFLVQRQQKKNEIA